MSLLTYLLRSVGITVTPDEGCRFVGAALAKSASSCDSEGFCTNIVYSHPELAIVSDIPKPGAIQGQKVPCSEALYTSIHAIEQSTGDTQVTDIDYHNIRNALEVYLNVHLRDVIHQFKPLNADAIRLMRRVFSFIVYEVRTHWDHRLNIQRAIGRSLLENLLNVHEALVWRCLSSSHSGDPNADLLAPVFHFWFDLVAVIPGIHIEGPLGIVPVITQTMARPPVHRPYWPGETHAAPRVPLKTAEVIAIAESIESTKNAAIRYSRESPVKADWFPSGIDFDRIDLLLSLTDSADTRSSIAMLLHLLRTRLCPALTAVVELMELSTELPRSVLVKTGVSLIKECVSEVGIDERIQASVAVGRLLYEIEPGPPIVLPTLEDTDALGIFGNNALHWIQGVNFLQFQGRYHMFCEQLLEVPNPLELIEIEGLTYFFSDDDDVFLAIGRFLGLGVRYHRQPSFIEPSIVSLIQSPKGVSPLFEPLVEPIFYLRAGLVETLGPACFEGFTESEFQFLLGSHT